LIGVILIVLGGWALAKLAQGEAHVEEQAERIDAVLEAEKKSTEQATELLERAERRLGAYLAAGEAREKAKFVRHPARVAPLMDAYYRTHDLKPAKFASIENFQPFGVENRPFIYVEAKLADGSLRPLSMEQCADGELRIDWESEVAYMPMRLEEFVEKKPGEAMDFRGYARLDMFYSYEFADQKRYQAVMLTERESEHFLFGYIERGTEDCERLIRLLAPQIRTPKPVMMRIRFLPGTISRRSVLIEKFVSPRWIHVEDPSDAKREKMVPG
jgi:hypothetical protein